MVFTSTTECLREKIARMIKDKRKQRKHENKNLTDETDRLGKMIEHTTLKDIVEMPLCRTLPGEVV